MFSTQQKSGLSLLAGAIAAMGNFDTTKILPFFDYRGRWGMMRDGKSRRRNNAGAFGHTRKLGCQTLNSRALRNCHRMRGLSL